MKLIQNSAILWKDNTPFSQQFEDYYYNSDGGIDETLHVFVNPNNIVDRYCSQTDNYFCINETGFGTGLNFYCTVAAIQQVSSLVLSKPLYFFSSELFPLSVDDFKKSVTNFVQFKHITDQICAQYPPPIKGFHRIILNEGSVYLTLMFDDSLSAFKQCQHVTQAWYLDGFSPAKNSDMWQPALFEQLARLSETNRTTLATFTSAGFVRRALQETGFEISKHNGFGKKREMISGLFTQKNAAHSIAKPWFNLPNDSVIPHHQTPTNAIKHVAIIGAGLAGCTSAEALARRGIKVTIFDAANDICAHASGNIQGALYAKLPSKPTVSGELHLTGMEYSLRLLEIYQCFDNNIAQQCGLLQLATNEKEAAQQQDLLTQNYYHNSVVYWVDAEQASLLAGTKTPFSGLFFPRSGWVAPKNFCQKIISSNSISLMLNTEISELTQLPDNRWQLSTANSQEFTFDAVIVANANSAKQFAQLHELSTKAIRGQVTHCEAQAENDLKTVVCGAGYISPAIKKQFCFGASFDLHNLDSQLKHLDQQTNINNLKKVLPQFAAKLTFTEQLQGKVAQRCSSPDYLPLVGPAPIHQQFIEKYAKLRKDKNWRFENSPAPNYHGLFINTGHGAKGLITCPLSAEYLACLIAKQPSPLPTQLSNALHPARFVIKQLIRRAI
ncbi:MAG: bifunctional tRNA (5-methylaminomethyl-2-thiouridine)(34)-methyltransferase MnmD/FAD-dependent 5-carboxymethylaminomethyl-2-thiouridine(34) oxidoreductase MnmC [Oceanospirillaceae bacterium]